MSTKFSLRCTPSVILGLGLYFWLHLVTLPQELQRKYSLHSDIVLLHFRCTLKLQIYLQCFFHSIIVFFDRIERKKGCFSLQDPSHITNFYIHIAAQLCLCRGLDPIWGSRLKSHSVGVCARVLRFQHPSQRTVGGIFAVRTMDLQVTLFLLIFLPLSFFATLGFCCV